MHHKKKRKVREQKQNNATANRNKSGGEISGPFHN